MTRSVLHARARTLQYLSTPGLWPAWPFLPVIRRSRGYDELGVVFDARAARITGYSATVFLTNLFELPSKFVEFLALPKEVFDCVEELAESGWQVD